MSVIEAAKCSQALKNQFAILLLLLVFVGGCSTKNNGFLNRAYHNTTARYNGYFNARESIKEGVRTYRDQQETDYADLLPLYLSPEEENASVMAPYMEKAVKKSSTVINRHSMEIKGEEHCRWIDDNYMAIGIAHFYKYDLEEAANVLDYVVENYPDNPRRPEAMIWLIRTYLKMGEPEEAVLLIEELNALEELDKKQLKARARLNAHYHIYRESYGDAIPHLTQAIGMEKRKKKRIPMQFLLGQLYMKQGKPEMAIGSFRIVAKKSPDYSMSFQAQIMQARSVDNKAMGLQVKKDLNDMLKDDKNLEYFDQIYYALADIAFVERDYDEAVEYLEKSIASSVNNPKQKARSFLRLGDYYFDQKRYEPAGNNYDSAVTYLPESAENYERVAEKQQDLKALVNELQTIERNDSLLVLADLSEAELLDRVKRIRSILERRERERQQSLLNQQPVGSGGAKPVAANNPGGATRGSWYFYNARARSLGQQEFLKTWGKRSLEDHWRRKQKSASTFASADTSGTTGNAVAGVNGKAVKVPSLDALLADVPNNPADYQKAHREIMESLYQSGVLYKEQFTDIDNAIEAFENLVSRYDTTRYRLITFYQLYRLYLQKENQSESGFFSFDTKSSSMYYKDQILYEYPESEFAALLSNPDHQSDRRKNEAESERLYREVYELYRRDSLYQAGRRIDSLITAGVTLELARKLHLLHALVYSSQREINAFVNELQYVITNYPNTEEAKQARELFQRVKQFLKDQGQDEGGNNGVIADSLGKATPMPGDTAAADARQQLIDSLFVKNKSGNHYYIIVCAEQTGAAVNALKSKLSDFNKKFFGDKPLSVTQSFIGNKNPILLVKTFTSDEDAMKYYHAIETNKETELKLIDNKGLVHFAVTMKNFISLFKSKNVSAYNEFFAQSYLDK